VTLFKATNQVQMYFHTVLVLQYNMKKLPAAMSVRKVWASFWGMQ
jgi:hypothetical protein